MRAVAALPACAVLWPLAAGVSGQERPTDRSPLPAAFHVVDVRVGTTSDWTVVHVGGESVLTSQVKKATAGIIESTSAGGRMTLQQSLADAKGGRQVGITVRLALESTGAEGALKVVIEKGAIGTTTVALEVHPGPASEGAKQPLGDEVESTGVVAGDTDRNRREFEVDASALRALAPRRTTTEDAASPVTIVQGGRLRLVSQLGSSLSD